MFSVDDNSHPSLNNRLNVKLPYVRKIFADIVWKHFNLDNLNEVEKSFIVGSQFLSELCSELHFQNTKGNRRKLKHTYLRDIKPLIYIYRQTKSVLTTLIDDPMHKHLEVKPSKMHGLGLFAKRDFKTDELIITYHGQNVTLNERDRRAKDYEKDDKEVYFFQLKNRIIDATVEGNFARYSNHSCKPNAIVVRCSSNLKLNYVAMENISAGEEIYIDYSFDDDRTGPEFFCLCGNVECRFENGQSYGVVADEPVADELVSDELVAFELFADELFADE